jgi:hypothetical protein
MLPPCYVISLKDSLGDQGKALKKIGLNPILFRGVNAKKKEHLNFVDHIKPLCLHICPHSNIGIALSHKFVAKKLYDSNVNMGIIMEDDAFPIDGINLEYEIKKVLEEVPDDWNIIRMHCDSHCINGQNYIGKDDSSGAAYIINRRGMEIMINSKVKGHIDFQQNETMQVYKTRKNLFVTIETNSTNRIHTHTIISDIMDIINPIKTGEKTWDDKLSYKSVRIPYTDIELSLIHFRVLIFIVLVILFGIFRKNSFL